jgi:polyisoprenoid-binding protein YceI
MIHLLLALVLAGWGAEVSAQTYQARNGLVEFTSRAPLLTFTGTSRQLLGLINLSDGAVDFYVDLNTLETGIRRRDRDMRTVYLETSRFPFAEFKGRLVTPIDPSRAGPQPARVRGEFIMRGITRPFEATGTIERSGRGFRVQAGWEIRLNDYNIERPRVVFYELNDVQEVRIDILLLP